MMKRMLLTAALATACTAFAGKPVALMGFGTDVKTIKSDVTDRCRYVSVVLADKWLDPADYGKYSVLYFGEKLRGEAKGRNWREGEARAAAEKFIEGGGLVIVAGSTAMNELFGKPSRKNPDALREKVAFVDRSLGAMKRGYSKAGKKLSFADDAGNDVLTEEGRNVKALQDRFLAAFARAKDSIEMLPEGEKWETVPLGEPGNLVLPNRFKNRPKLGKPVARPDGLVLLDGARKAVVALGDCGEDVRKLAEELAWHLEQMAGGVKFDVVEGEPANGPALVYRTVKCPAGFARGTAAYFKIWREGDKVYLGGEDTGKSRATTYVLESLGCRYIWPGCAGKVIPKKQRIVLPEIAVEDATPMVIRRMRLHGWQVVTDRPGNRDFWRWHGMNDMKFMTTDNPGDADGYQWGHYFKDFYPKYRTKKPELFALQPDGTRTLHLGSHTERPTFCLSNLELVDITAQRKIEESNANPSKKALSLCLPDGATSSWCMCPACRAMDPANAPKGGVTVFFPERRSVPYVSFTDRVFEFMNRVTEKVAAVHPDKLLSTYAYSCYTKPPVKTVPHRNLLILSVAGSYANADSFGTVEANLAAWSSFGNKLLWRPNAHGGFRVSAPDNFARRMFDDVSLMMENGIFGVDYDTMSSEWATKPFTYYVTTKAHFNPDRLDFESFAEDYCRTAFGAAAADVRAYFDAVERADEAAAKANAEDKEPALGWVQRTKRQNRLLEHLDFDALDAHLAKARAAAAGDADVLARIRRLQFGDDVGRYVAKKRIGRPAKPTEEETAAFVKMVEEYLAEDPSAYKIGRLVRK